MDMGKIMMVGEWLLSNVVDKLADKVLLDQYDQFTGEKTMVEDVKAKLPRIRAVIQAAEGRPIRDPALATWLRELKDAAYEADDMLDELEFNELHHRLFNKRKVSDFVSSAVKLLRHFIKFDDDLKNLKNLVGNFDKIYPNIDYIKEQLENYISKQSSVTRETSAIIDVIVFGRNKETQMILDKLHLDDGPESLKKYEAGSSSDPSPPALPSLGVLPIVGIGGVGKTTLAQLIYNHERVVSHFELRKWVYVSDDFDVKRISKELAYDLISTDMSLDVILRTLENAMRNKRFFFVLDDVWDDTGREWEKLRGALTSGARGSMVLVTTQSPVVAKVMGTMDPIELNCLQENEYSELFEHCAFGDQILVEERRERLQAIGRQISQKLHGLPLAGRVLGSLLKTELDEDHWKRILKSEWWELEVVLDNILPSLALSYEHLKPNLKQCFAYCSTFPKSHMFEKDRLVEMWIAQGFIQNQDRGRMTMEDIGSQIFDELTRRYFFLPTLTDKYVMHDLIRELAVYVSLDECLVISDARAEIPKTIHHLTLRTDNLDAFKDRCELANLRSILFIGDYDSRKLYRFLHGMLTQSKSLRVLDLSYSRLKKLPDAIRRLSHLRYLDLSSSKIRELPNSFGQLCHLQVLNVRSCYITSFPEGMNKLINLRHLYGEVDTISKITGIGDLTNLQELEEFRVTKEQRHRIGELERLRNLRGRLCIKNLQNVESKEEAMKAMLKDKEHLTKLHLEWIFDAESLPHAEEIFEGLQPHPSLEELEIKGYGGIRFPTWMVENKFLNNLELICLESCGRLESIPPLGQLPLLKDLHIQYMPAIKQIGREFYGDTGVAFPSLQVLIFNVFDEWEEWLEADGAQILPRLRNLFLHNCFKLWKVPLLFLSSSLVELNIKDCGDFGSALPGCLQGLTSLINLAITRYAAQVSLRLSNLRALKHLHLEDCPEMKLVGGLQFLASLELLHLKGCPELIEASERGQLREQPGPRSLIRLNIDDTILLRNLWILLGSLRSLQHLWIHPGHRMTNFTEEHELWFRLLTSLQILEIEDSQSLESLPTSLVNFSSIRTLAIRTCPAVSSLPEYDLPTSLKELHIRDCPVLKHRCQKEGADWPKIAHIPLVCIDDETIQML